MTKAQRVEPKKCMKIQWSPVCLDEDDNIVCPDCGKAAEAILGIFANPCYAHAIKATEDAQTAE